MLPVFWEAEFSKVSGKRKSTHPILHGLDRERTFRPRLELPCIPHLHCGRVLSPCLNARLRLRGDHALSLCTRTFLPTAPRESLSPSRCASGFRTPISRLERERRVGMLY